MSLSTFTAASGRARDPFYGPQTALALLNFADQFPIAPVQGGEGTSTNMNLNEVLATQASQLLPDGGDEVEIHFNDDVNRSQSSNDTCSTAAMRLAVLTLYSEATEALSELEASLLVHAEADNDVVRLGRTCWQDAVPVTVGETHRAQARAVTRGRVGIQSGVAELASVPFGATAIGTPVGAPPGSAAAAVALRHEIAGTNCTVAPDLFDAPAHLDPSSALAAAIVEPVILDSLMTGRTGGAGS